MLLIGFLYTNEEIVRSFIPGEELELNVIISNRHYARHIYSIAWYHNGTQITSGNKYSITYNPRTNTSLSIQNMVGSDAGIYEAKIESIEYYEYNRLSLCYYYGYSSPHCDSIMLPLLETHAIHTPVTFTVQEHRIPTYDPQPIVSSYSIPECPDRGGCNIDLRSSGLNITGILLPIGRYQSEWYKNGVRNRDLNVTYNSSVINEEGFVINSLQIAYNNTEDITGNYVGFTQSDLYGYLGDECRVYFYYLCFIDFFPIYPFTFELSYWKISGELIFSNLLCNLVQ